MFNKKKKEENKEEKKKKGMVDKVVMGAIIGGAIGSVVGITVAPKSGKETRQYIKDKGKEVYDKGKEAKEMIVEKYGDDIDNIKKESSKVWNYLMKKLFKKKK